MKFNHYSTNLFNRNPSPIESPKILIAVKLINKVRFCYVTQCQTFPFEDSIRNDQHQTAKFSFKMLYNSKQLHGILNHASLLID